MLCIGENTVHGRAPKRISGSSIPKLTAVRFCCFLNCGSCKVHGWINLHIIGLHNIQDSFKCLKVTWVPGLNSSAKSIGAELPEVSTFTAWTIGFSPVSLSPTQTQTKLLRSVDGHTSTCHDQPSKRWFYPRKKHCSFTGHA